MKKCQSVITVAVTGVGAIIGQGIVKSLRCSKYDLRVVGVDLSDRSPGPYLVDVFEKKPFIDEANEDYLGFWMDIIKRHGIQLILPGLEIDMIFFDRHRKNLLESGVELAINSSELIEKTIDKWRFGQELKQIKYPEIPSIRPSTWEEACKELGRPPFLLKPLRGNGSRGIVLLHDELDFNYWKIKAGCEWLLQRIVGVPEEEYTVGTFGLGSGEACGSLIFRRRLSSAGNTLEAAVVHEHPVIESAVDFLVGNFNPIGPTNFQFRVEGQTAFLLEINPRFSSSNSLRTAFGFNEAQMAVEYYLFKKKPGRPKVMGGIAWRYAEDYIINAGHNI